jgi:hypothetical protein
MNSMGSPRIAIGLSTLLASLMLVSAAAAETVVPPGNGAATQYTEAIPTSGGNAVPGSGIKGGGGHRAPSHVLGHQNARHLESEGKVGREVAEVAAETAPPKSGVAAPSSSSAPRGTGGGGGSNPQGAGTSGSGGGDQVVPAAQGNGGVTAGNGSSGSGGGSSGLGEVIGQATGASSGQSGLLLPLILLAAVIASIAYAWRRRVAH